MTFFNLEMETMPIEKLRTIQSERLIKQVNLAYNTVPYYKNSFDKAGLLPKDIRSIHDIHRIPFMTKDALRTEYPFGLMTQDRRNFSRLHCSSGTTGKPIVVGYTPNDLNVFSEVVARSLMTGGCTPGELIQNAYGYGLFTGGLGIHDGAERLGMTVLPISGGGTDKQIMLMKDFQSEVICCTPSYALTIANELHQRGISLSELGLKKAILGAEPWTESIRKEIETKLGVSATNIYGLTEIIGPGVAQEDFEEKGTGSYIWEDHFYPEIVDKDTGLPVPEGEFGVLVFTTLTKEGMPMLRFWTNDITNIYYEHSYKRTHIKMGQLRGRADEMLIVRGVNLFHTQVEAVLEKFSDCFSNNYQLVVDRIGAMDEILVKVEIDAKTFEKLSADFEQPLACNYLQVEHKRLCDHLKADIGLSMKVELQVPYSLSNKEGGKSKRILDKRINQGI